MYKEEYIHYSYHLEKEMHLMVYGDKGIPVLAFPTQDSKCKNYEDFGMIDVLSDFIENGQIQIFVVDTVDEGSWSNTNGNKAWRADWQERYYSYITEEVYGMIRKRNSSKVLPFTTGCSMGANHAAITFLRRPDLFSGMLALSGVYDSKVFFGDWSDGKLYANSPEMFLPNMPNDHPYIDLYNQKKIIFCVGQGAWEEDGVRSLRNLQQIFKDKGINAWCDFWGYDVNHDWDWWFKQMRYFLPFMLRGESAVG